MYVLYLIWSPMGNYSVIMYDIYRYGGMVLEAPGHISAISIYYKKWNSAWKGELSLCD